MKIKTTLLIAITLLIAVVGCKKKDAGTPVSMESFHEFVYGVTSGQIKRSDAIVIKFSSELVSTEEIGSTVASSVLSFSPSIEGKAVWASTDAIEFKPTNLLDWDASYQGKLKLSKLMKVPKQLSTLTFNFNTTTKQIRVSERGLSISDKNDKTYELPIEIVTSDLIDDKEIEDIFTAEQDGDKLSLLWNHQAKSNTHSFRVLEIKRKERQSEIEVEWAGSKIDLENGKGSIKVEVPSLKDFAVTSVLVINSPDQHIEISFSDPIQNQIDLRGLIQLDNENIDQISVERNLLKAYPSEQITGTKTLKLNASIESELGYKLESNYIEQLNFGGTKPQIRLLGKGVIVPQSTGLYFPFEATSLNAVDVRITKIFKNNIHAFLQNQNFDNTWSLHQVGRTIKRMKVDLTNKGPKDLNTWNAFNLDLTKIITVEPGAIYNIEIGFRKEYSTFPCESEDDKSNKFVPIEDEQEYPEKEYSNVFYNYYNDWDEDDNPCKYAYYSPYKFIKRNILGSNFGIIAKKGQNKNTNIYVSNLLTAEPEQGVEITLYDYQNQFLTKAKTNSEGMISVKTEFDPFLVIAEKDKQIGYLKIDDGTSLSLSNFDVSGVSVQKGMKGFIYGERSVWRPGDSIYVSFILEDKLKSLPDGHPLVMEVFNPKGQFVQKMVRNKSEKSIYTFYFKTNADDPTGNWRLVVNAGGSQFNKSIQVETVKPNRLKIDLSFSDKILSSRKSSKGKLEAKWLHGMPAKNLGARVDVSFSQIAPKFDNFKDYDFSTPFGGNTVNNQTLFDGKLNQEGKADITFDLKTNKNVNGFLNASFTTKVFEEGGDFSINSFSKPYSPYPDYVGTKINWSYEGWKKLNIEENHVIKVATVDEDGKPISLSGIQVKIYKLEYSWWYDSNDENLASYAGTTHYTPVISKTINSVNGKAEFTITPDEDMWGRHLMLITSPNGHISGQVIYFGWDWGRDRQNGGAQVLALVAEKTNYKVGEKVTIGFPANKNATALITFENGNGVIGQQWMKNLNSFTEYTFEATPAMSPNVYVSISLIQPHGQTVNDLPIRLYGVIPIMVEDPETRLQPVINMPAEVRPLKEFTINIKEKNRKAMDYTVAIVDEGLLDITNFKTPDPWGSFYAREALGVKSYDMYNYVMGSFGSRIESMFAVGGSNNGLDQSKKKAERFKPVVKVLGPFHLDANREASHKITLPQYVGSVRTMVIAASEGKYGNAEKAVPVREPLMVLATLPRVLSPDETVDLPVTVFAMNESVKKVQVHISSNPNIQIIGRSDTTIVFNSTGEKNISFKIKSASKQGFAKVKVEVQSGTEKSFNEIELDIRLPNLPETTSQFKLLAAGEKWVCEQSAFGIEGTNKLQLEVSSLPPLNLGRRLEYLIRYPHGCVEQTTSSVFPQVYLPSLLSLSADDQQKVKKNVTAGIERLQRFQLANGAFTYWPGSSYVEEWASCYVGYFLLEAEKAGYIVPSNMKKKWLQYTAKAASQYSINSQHNYYNYIQAYRLYLLSVAGEPQVSAMNRLRTSTYLNNQTKWLLAGAYALASMKDAAYKLIDFRNMTPDKPDPECYGSELRDKGIILQTLVALKEWDHAAKVALEVSKSISNDSWYGTQSTAYSLVALSSFAVQTGSNDEINFKQTINGETTAIRSKIKFYNTEPQFNKTGNATIVVENSGKGSLFVNVFNTGAKKDVDLTSAEKGMQMEVKYFDSNMNPIDTKTLQQGTDFTAMVMVKNKTAARVKNIALSQLFPSGWEIINTRLVPGAGINKNSPFDYCDFRDDRVYIYFGLDSYESKTFTVNLNAAYCGEFIQSPVICSDMYDNNFMAKTPGRTVKVMKN